MLSKHNLLLAGVSLHGAVEQYGEESARGLTVTLL